jgi:hypothetical protein
VKDRSAVGIADGLGGNASINASLAGEGGDRWGLFLNPAQYKADLKAEEGGAYGGRKIDRLSDLTSLSFRVNHSGNGSYPTLGFQMARNTTADDGKTVAQLDVDMSQMPATRRPDGSLSPSTSMRRLSAVLIFLKQKAPKQRRCLSGLPSTATGAST